jgi:hypothetical protein
MFSLVFGLAAAVAKADRPFLCFPDGRFAIRFIADSKNGSFFRVFNRRTKRTIARIADESGGAFSALSKFVWAPDSNRVALNFQSGIRYATTNVYQFQKGTFTELKDLEEGIGDSVIETEKIRLRKEGGFPPESSERRVFDRWFVERWTDPKHCNSARSIHSGSRHPRERSRNDGPHRVGATYDKVRRPGRVEGCQIRGPFK